MKVPTPTIILALAAVFFASCAPSTPQGRIEQDPARFSKLSNRDKSMVEQGNIRTGMKQDAVYLAWGRPNAVAKGGSGNASTERWTYTGQTSVRTNNVNIGYGGGYGRHRGYGGYYDYGPSITYIPYTAGVVHFTNDRVSKWEESGR
jgi:hypothetical protein